MSKTLLVLLLPTVLLGCPAKDTSGDDTGISDGGATDGGVTDGGATDGGTSTTTDGGGTDGGGTDGGGTDGGGTDGGGTDGGGTDGGGTDGGGTDGGGTDGGGTDGGTTGVDLTADASSEIAHMQQYDGYAEDDVVTVTGVVSSPDTGSGFFMADAEGPWAGIWVYSGGITAVTQGDAVSVTATLVEYNDLTELNASAGAITIDGVGTIPDPTLISTADLTDADVAEAFESVFIQLAGVTVTDGNPDGPDSDYGEFVLDDVLRVDDLFYDANPATDDSYSMIQGLLSYSYSQFKLDPRDAGDVR